jgi:hypothetical protein
VTARLTVLLCALLLIAPAAALAQDPFGPIPPAPPQQTEPPEDEEEETQNPFEEDEGLSSTQQFLIGISGAVMVFGIAWFILRDARRSAPVEHHRTEAEGGTKSHGSRVPKQRRHTEGRQRAKAARQQRKKQRKKQR